MNNSLVELTELIIKGLVNDSESVSVKEFESDEDNTVLIEVMVNGDDMAKVIGHGGKTINSIRTIGLIKGINSFDVDKGSKLSTYVSRCIDNEILMYLRSTKKLNAEVYLNEPIGKDKDDNIVTLQEVLENDDRNIEDEVDLKIKIKKLYTKIKEVLKDRERTIIELRFGLDGNKPKTQHEIAKMMGISRSYVSRIETKAIGKLNKEFKE